MNAHPTLIRQQRAEADSADSEARLQDAYQVLQFNQQLVQFADSKAGTLILINSLFIAAAQASHAGGNQPEHWLQVACILLSSLGVLHCMMVVMSRGGFHSNLKPDLVFFGDILSRDRFRYQHDFRTTSPGGHLDGVLGRSYEVASIARLKFNRFVTAQKLTAISAVLWVAANALALV